MALPGIGSFVGGGYEEILRGADCTLLLHFEGADGSTTFTDETGLQTWTAGGNARIRTANSRFGGSSLYLDGSGDYILPGASASPAGLAFGTGDYTVDFWFNGNAGFDGLLWDSRSGSSTSGRLLFGVGPGDGITVPSGEWHHFARTRQAGTRRTFIDGVLLSSAAEATNFASGFNRPVIGCDGNGLGTAFWEGFIDEYHVRKGTAQWVSNFSPPQNPYI